MFTNLNNNEIVNTFRYLHRIPELEWQEYKTSEYIFRKLSEFGLNPVKCVQTGVYADIISDKNPDNFILFRADIDALPVKEETGLEYASEHDGIMHACGHDFHTTSLLYAAKILHENHSKLPISVRVVFQPAEEGTGGALPMINEGIMQKVVSAYAIHAEPMKKTGTVLYKDGGITASPDDFSIKITGKGGHGAEPEKCINPITISSEVIQRLNKIKETHFKNESCIISVCTVNSGSFYNIIPESAEITGTVRSCSPDTRDKLELTMKECVLNTVKEYGANAQFVFNRSYPPTVCSEMTNKIAVKAAKATEGIEEITELKESYFIGDDFAYFSELVPSSYIRFGTSAEGNFCPLHSSKLKIDENSLIIATKYIVNIAMKSDI